MKRKAILAAAALAAFATATTGALAADNTKKEESSASGGSSSAASDKGASAGSGQSKGRNASSGAGAPAANAPAIVLVPVAIATAPSFSNGCWARLHDSTDFKGNHLSLVGPVDMPNMRTAFGTDWSGQFDSLEVGPKATLTVYDNENYAEKAATFKPGQKVRDLDEKMGMFEQIRSAKIACAGAAKTAQQSGPSGSSAGATKKPSDAPAGSSGSK